MTGGYYILMKFKNKLSNLIALAILLAIGLAYLVGVLLRHFRLESFGYDLGIFAQEIYLLSKLKIPLSTIKIPNMIIWGDHWTLSMLIFAPLVWLFKDPSLILLVAQVLITILSGAMIYYLSLKKTGRFYFSLSLMIVFLLFFGVQNALFFDFHPVVFGAMLLPFLFYFEEKKEWFWFWPLSFLIANFKEDLIVITALWGLNLFIFKKKRWGLIMAGAYSAWFLMVRFILIPSFSPHGYLYAFHLEGGILTLTWKFISSGQNWILPILLLANFLFLPLFDLQSMILVIAILLEMLFMAVSEFGKGWLIDRHYQAIFGPILAMGAINGYAFLMKKERLKRLIGVIPVFLVITALWFQYYLHLQLNLLTKRDYWNLGNKQAVIKELKSIIPAHASLTTQNNLIPHFAARRALYEANFSDNRLGTKGADFLLVDFRPHQNPVNFLQSNIKPEFKKNFFNLVNGRKGDYQIIWRRNDVFLAKRN